MKLNRKPEFTAGAALGIGLTRVFVLFNAAVTAVTVALVVTQNAEGSWPVTTVASALLALQVYAHYRFTLASTRLHPLLSLDVLLIFGIVVVSWAIPALMYFDRFTFGSTYWSRLAASQYFSQAQPIALLAVAGVCAGALAHRALWGRSQASAGEWPRLRSQQMAVALAVPGTLLLAYFLFSVGALYLSGSYQDIYSVDERFETPFFFAQLLLTLAAAAGVAGGAHATGRSRAGVLIACPYVALLSVLAVHGDRGQLVICGSPLLYWLLAGHAQKRRRWFAGATSVLVILLALVVMGVVREARNVEERGFASFAKAATHVSLSTTVTAAAANIGTSGLLLPAAMEYTDVHGHTRGRFALIGVLGVIPYSRRALQRIGVFETGTFMSSSDLLTYRALGPRSTSGTGTTTIADLYLDFGWPGVFLGHVLLGMIAAMLRHRLASARNAYRAATLYLFSIGVYAVMARYAPVTMLVRYVLYGAILLIGADALCAVLRNVSKRGCTQRGGWAVTESTQ